MDKENFALDDGNSVMDAPTLNKPKTMKINGQFTSPSLDNLDYYRYRKRMVMGSREFGEDQVDDDYDFAKMMDEGCDCRARRMPGLLVVFPLKEVV